MQLRHARPGDLAALAAVETACFPSAEAAGPAALAARLAAFPAAVPAFVGRRYAGRVHQRHADRRPRPVR